MATVGFTETSYTVDEDAGTASVMIGVISGTIQRDVSLLLSLADGSAIGEINMIYQYTYTSYLCGHSL